MRVKSRCLYVIAVDELGVDGILTQNMGIARHQQLLAGTRHSDIEFAVDGASVLFNGLSVWMIIGQQYMARVSAKLHRPPAQREKRGTVIHSVFQY